MKIKTDDLQAAFKICDSVPLNVALDSSQFVRLRQEGDNLTLSLTGSMRAEVTIKGQSQGGKWTAYVDRKTLKTFSNTANTPDTEIFYKDKLTLKAGQRLELALHATVSGYETYAPKSPFALEDEQLSFLKIAVRYIPNMTGTEMCEAVSFGKEALIVTDKTVMIEKRGTNVKKDFIMPGEIAKFLTSHTDKISVDTNGVGVVLPNGSVFQSRSAHLDQFPISGCQQIFSDAKSAPVLCKFKAESFLEALRAAVQFLPDKAGPVTIEGKDSTLSVTVDNPTARFQRTIPITSKTLVTTNIRAAAIIPWLEYAGDVELSYSQPITAKTSNVSAFRFKDNTLVVANL